MNFYWRWYGNVQTKVLCLLIINIHTYIQWKYNIFIHNNAGKQFLENHVIRYVES